MNTSPPSPRRGRLRRIVLGLAAVILLIVVVVAGLTVIGLRTARGHAWIEAQLNRRLAAVGGAWRLQIEGLSGRLPFQPKITRLTIADADGTWLAAEGIRAQVDGRAILRGQVRIRWVEADHVAWHRLPVADPDRDDGAPEGDGDVPAWWISIDRLHLPDVELFDALPGGAARLAVEADARLAPAEGLHARLLVVRRDDATDARAHARIHWPGPGAPTQVWMDLTEEDGGWIGRHSPWLAGGLRIEGEGSVRSDFMHGVLVFRGGVLGRGRFTAQAERDAFWRIEAEGSTRGLRVAGLDLDLPRLVVGMDLQPRRESLALAGDVRVGTDRASFDLALAREESQVRVSRFRIVADDVHVHGSGTATLDGGGIDAHLSMGSLDLARPPFRATLQQQRAMETWPVSGTAHLTLDAAMVDDIQEVRLRASVKDLDIPAARLGEASADIVLRGPWSVPSAQGHVEIHRFHPRAWDAIWSYGIPFLRAEGSLAFGWLDLTLRAEAPGVEVEAWLDTPLDAVDLRRGMPWNAPHPFEGRVTTRVRADTFMAHLAPDASGWRGVVEAEIHGRGVMNAPEFDGRLELHGGRMEIPATGAVIENARITLVGEDDTLRIAEAYASDGHEGRLSASGYVRFPGLRAAPIVDIRLDLDRLRMVDLPYAVAAFSGDLQLSPDGSRHRLHGMLESREAELRMPARLPPQVPNYTVVDRNAPATTERDGPWPGLAVVDLDVRLRADRVRARGRGLESEWRARLHGMGTLAEPRLEGNLAAVRGRMQFLGRRFQIEEARLDWNGPIGSPVFHGVATSRAGGIVARIEATGPATEPAIRLDSEPPLPDDEILARILFGRSFDRLSPIQAIRLAHGLRVLHGGARSLDLLAHGQEWLQVDEFDLVQDEDDARLSAIRVGKYIGDRIYIEGAKGLGGAEDRLAVEIELTPSITLETETSPGLRQGVRLRWSRDY